MEDITNRCRVSVGASPVKVKQVVKAKKQKEEGDAKKIWKLDDFDIGPKKGEGMFGKVHLARVKGMKLVYGMKVMALKSLSPPQLEQELCIHRGLKHKHIVRFVTWFTDEINAYILMEWCMNGTIYDKMHDMGGRGFPQDIAAKYCAQLTEAVHYLHTRTPAILHRDIKPENTFLDGNDDLKLGDFGWSAVMKNARPRKTICGTLDYFAPELCNKEAYGKALDAWTIGIFTFEMCYGRPPFEVAEGSNENELMKQIQKSALRFPAHPAVDPEAKNLITALLQKEPGKRLDLPSILAHPWVQKHYYAKRKTQGQGK